MRTIKPEVFRGAAWGTVLTLMVAALIVIGSRNLDHFDAALVAYTFATLFATFGVSYRYTMWLQRPPTKLYWKRGWQVFFQRNLLPGNIVRWVKRLVGDFALNHFIFKRGSRRWLAHFLIMWGCLVAFAITFPLVWGWMHFFTVPGKPDWYRAYVFGFAVLDFPAHSIFAFVMFHGLVWCSFAVIAGVMMAMWRRLREHGAAALQQFGEDILPLVLLFAISVTGLMLTASYTWMRGYAFDFIAILHAITVIFTLLYAPFGKFFHVFQRPAQLGASFYKDAGERGEKAHCRRCGEAFSSVLHIKDLITVEKQLGYNYEMEGETEHYQWICPPCRRAMMALAQGLTWAPIHGDVPIHTAATAPHMPHPELGINVIGENPQGTEDQQNLHY